MKENKAFLISLVFGMTLVCAPMLAQAAQESAPPPPAGLPALPPPGSPLPPLPPLSRLDPDQRDAQRTIRGPYRLTYTLIEMDGSKRIGSQHYQLVQDADAQTSLNLGTRIPIDTGASGTSALPPLPQISYIDVGINIQCGLRQFANGLQLSSRVEQSAVDAQQSQSKTPVIRHTNLNDTILLQEDKPVILGNEDIPGSTHSLQVTVELTKLP